jgi:hypothetical protein
MEGVYADSPLEQALRSSIGHCTRSRSTGSLSLVIPGLPFTEPQPRGAGKR